MNSTDYKNSAEETVKIYVPRSFSGTAMGEASSESEKDEVKIYCRREDTSSSN